MTSDLTNRWTKSQDVVNQLRIENALRSAFLEKLPKSKWPPVKIPRDLKEVWRSRYYLVQVFQEKDGMERLSICISDVDAAGERWKDGLSWEMLQDIKHQVGRGNKDAVEVFPRDCDVVNVANMRHLWIMTKELPFAWRSNPSEYPGAKIKDD